METQKCPVTKQLRLPPCGDRHLRVSLLHLKKPKHPQAFPQLGELPALAGLLLYPGKRDKMVTTTETSYGPKSCARSEQKKMLQCSLILEGDRSFITTHQEAYQAQPLDGPLLMTKRKFSARNVKTPKEQTAQYLTNYRQNFLPPQGISTRRLLVLPCPDNLAVNPALRTDFRTVQMETYPGWGLPLHSRILPAQLGEQLPLKGKVLPPSLSRSRPPSSSLQSAMDKLMKTPGQHCVRSAEQRLQREKSPLEAEGSRGSLLTMCDDVITLC